MNALNVDRLGELVVEALERTAFVLAETVVDEDDKDRFAPSHFATISFTGAADGVVSLAADEGFVVEVAASLLGVEPEDITAENEGRQALCELSNIVGGSVIVELGGADRPYQYGLPTCVKRDELPPPTAGAVHSHVVSESGMLCVSWHPVTSASAAA